MAVQPRREDAVPRLRQPRAVQRGRLPLLGLSLFRQRIEIVQRPVEELQPCQRAAIGRGNPTAALGAERKKSSLK